MHRRALLLGGLLAAGCGWVVTPRAQTANAEAGLELLEPIYAVSATPTGLSVRIATNGCTTKSDLAFYVRHSDSQTTIAFGRRQAERCKPRSAPAGQVDLAFSYVELGVAPGTPLAVLNPLAPEPKRPTMPKRGKRRRTR